jgi:uncharacterized protein involved in cysteine biosynthesis
MYSIFAALARAMRDLTQPRVLAVLFLPMLIAVVAWSIAAYFFWDTWSGALRALVENTSVARWLMTRGANWAVESAGVLVIVALLLPAIVITAVVVTELVAMPVILSVASRRYLGLEKRKGGTIVGSITNVMLATTVFAVLWVVTLPLWLTGVGAVLLPLLLSAYLNQRLFRYDALADHASRVEYAAIVKRKKLALFGLGLVLAPLYYVPVLNLVAPVVVGLAFAHYCLGELARLRMSAAR